MGIDGELGDGVLTHERLEVGPHRIGALTQHTRLLIEHLIENLHALIGGTHLVGIGIHQRPAHLGGIPVADDGIDFASDVLDRLLNAREQGFERGEDGGSRHCVRIPAGHFHQDCCWWIRTFSSRPRAIHDANMDVPP